MAKKKLFVIYLLITCVAISTIIIYISLSDNHTTTFLKQEAPRPEDEPTNISHILFGISASVKTFPTRHHYIDLWWQSNVTRGFLWLEHEPYQNDTWPETSPPYKVSGNTSSFRYTGGPPKSRHQIRMARVVKESFELGLENVRWFVMGDDDTVFFPENLVSVLSKYDHNEMYYIGGNSECVIQNLRHSYKLAFGGAGVAISYPLAMVLAKELDGCIERYAHLYGSSERIQSCVSEIGVPLTQELGFHQVFKKLSTHNYKEARDRQPYWQTGDFKFLAGWSSVILKES
ncbi:hypothetical protein PIB30_082059 [Stylosanthes scabra]|uniref:N-acetylgalactosaminide beta-1,3-galactosyltransferase n=1 Tax=Stylosanthes scabra TaxID=79078 RepID=A0ABU6XQL0_9FABA|nr:hypothetical protein [Stylosanthes scabra]